MSCYFLSQSIFFPMSICWHSVLHDAHQTHPKSTISVSVAWFRLISRWKVFRLRSHVFGCAVTETSLSSLYRKTSDLQQTIRRLFSMFEMQFRGSVRDSLEMWLLSLCKAGGSPERKFWETEVKTLPKTEMPTRLIHLTSKSEVCTAYTSICL